MNRNNAARRHGPGTAQSRLSGALEGKWFALGLLLVSMGQGTLVAAQPCVPTMERPGLCNPLGDPADEPILRDDEAILFGFDGTTQTIAVQDTLSKTPRLKVLATRSGGIPVAAKGGRVLGIAAEQVVLVERTGTELRLELLSLSGCVEALPCPLVLGTHSFTTSNVASEVALDVYDLDGEAGDEVIVGFETAASDGARLRLLVLTFPGASATPDPEAFQGPVAATVMADVTLDHDHENRGSSYNLGLLRQQADGANHFEVEAGNLFFERQATIVVSHATPDDRLAILPLSFEALMNGETEALVVAREALPLTEEAADHGAWQVRVGPFDDNFGTPESIMTARQLDANTVDIRGLEIEFPETPQCSAGDGECTAGPRATMACTRREDCPSDPDRLVDYGNPYRGPLCEERSGPTCPDVSLLTNARWRSTEAPWEEPYELVGDPLGFFLLVQTSHGPVVQAIQVNSSEINAQFEPIRFGTYYWPFNTAFSERETFTEPGPVSFFVANVIHHRATANRYGFGTARSGSFFFDRRPSLYLQLPEGTPWDSLGRLQRIRSAVSNDNELEDSSRCEGGACELLMVDENDTTVQAAATVVMVAADVDGDSAYYRLRTNGGERPVQHTLYLGVPTQLTLENLTTPEIILEEPPKHVDYLREVNGGEVVNVSQSSDFSVAYRNSVTESVQVESETVRSTSFGDARELGASLKVGGAIKLLTGSAEASLTTRLETAVDRASTVFELSTSSTTLSQTYETSNDDQLGTTTRTVDIWRFPTIGVRGESPEEDPVYPFFDFVVPGNEVRSAQSGRNNPQYNPEHINGNVLSYPRFNSVRDVAEDASADLSGFSVGGECVAGTCVGGPLNGTRCARVRDCAPPNPSEVPVWAESSFDLGADTTTTLSFLDSSTAGSRMSYSRSISESTSFSATASLGVAAGPLSLGGSVSGSYSVNEGHSFAESRVTSNSTLSTNEIALNAPPLGTPEQSYSFAPAFYFERTGAVKVTHQVNLPTGLASFWSAHYSGPDAALSLPNRIVCSAGVCALNTGASRYAMKGLFIRFADDNPLDRHLVTGPVPAGTPLLLQVQVYNLSVGSSTGEVLVRFAVEEVGTDGSATGRQATLGDAVIDDIAPGGVQYASIEWDTTGFGNELGGEDRRYRVRVVLDPENTIEETHEWADRDGDPLRDDNGQVLDRSIEPSSGQSVTLEKGQNNEGWGSLTVTASDASCEGQPTPCGLSSGGSSSGGGCSATGHREPETLAWMLFFGLVLVRRARRRSNP